MSRGPRCIYARQLASGTSPSPKHGPNSKGTVTVTSVRRLPVHSDSLSGHGPTKRLAAERYLRVLEYMQGAAARPDAARSRYSRIADSGAVRFQFCHVLCTPREHPQPAQAVTASASGLQAPASANDQQ